MTQTQIKIDIAKEENETGKDTKEIKIKWVVYEETNDEENDLVPD